MQRQQTFNLFRQMAIIEKFKKKRIMVVDDEEFCISAMKGLIKRTGIAIDYQVDFLISGEEALATLKKATEMHSSYQIIFTDFNMPQMDGIEATI